MGTTQRLVLDLTPLDTPSGPRGIGRYIRELAKGLAALPKEELEGIELVALTSLTWTGGYEVTNDVASYSGGKRSAAPTEANFYEWAWRQRLALWRAVRRIGADAVHICDPHATPLFLQFSGCRRIVTCHDLVPTRFPDRYFGAKDGGAYLGKRIERRRYLGADLVVAVSDATRSDAVSLLGVPPARIRTVHEGIDIDWWAASRDQTIRPTLERFGLLDKPFVLYVGGSDWRKNVEGMMAGLAVARTRGTELDLVWAGHLSPGHVEMVEAAANRFGVSPFLRRLGYVPDDDLASLYRAARAHLLVSRCEGFGLTVVEAMASGCPVITTSGGSLAEVAGDAALKVDPDDHDAIGESLVRVSSDENLRADLARRGRERASLFSRSAQARAMARVYRDFMSGDLAQRDGSELALAK
jgi:glycosyltransferase involved in cell wall biosynthesis